MATKRIIIFGDSIAYGKYDPTNGGWANSLSRYVMQEQTFSVYNVSISGNTSKHIVQRFSSEVHPRTNKDQKKTYIIFAFGINDSRCNDDANSLETAEDEFKANLQNVYEQAKIIGQVIFLGITPCVEHLTTPVSWAQTRHYTNENIKIFDNFIRNFCEKQDALYLPLFDKLTQNDILQGNDGLHPNTEGHKKIFEAVKSFLEDNNII